MSVKIPDCTLIFYILYILMREHSFGFKNVVEKGVEAQKLRHHHMTHQTKTLILQSNNYFFLSIYLSKNKIQSNTTLYTHLHHSILKNNSFFPFTQSIALSLSFPHSLPYPTFTFLTNNQHTMHAYICK